MANVPRNWQVSVIVYPPDDNMVVIELENADQSMAIEFADEDNAILFYEFMKQASITANE